MPSNLQLGTYSDFDLLHIVNDLADNDGWATTEEIAQRVGLTHKHPNHCVGIRFAWMRREGAVEKHPKEGKWRMTDRGRALALNGLDVVERATFAEMSDNKLLAMMREMTGRYSTGDQVTANLMRREWRYGTDKSRRNGGRR